MIDRLFGKKVWSLGLRRICGRGKRLIDVGGGQGGGLWWEGRRGEPAMGGERPLMVRVW